MKKLLLLLILLSLKTIAQIDTSFFPDFQAYPANPILKYGDGFPDASWNDPCILKEGSQYIMYISAANGIIGTTTVKIYRFVSPDGYAWTLSPSTPVVQAAPGTYYEGGTETPSVVYKDSTYHMYLTTYTANVVSEFNIGHAVSSDGINWTMDTVPILESDGSATWNGSIVGEPGAIVYHDSIYVFFTGVGVVGVGVVQCIGLIKSADGTNFGAAQQEVLLPEDVYPMSADYIGLSTPSALAINDSIYVFTDVARTIGGNWTQVALHQFKTDGVSGIWYHDDAPIHTMQDFPWTDGDYLSEIRSICPLMDDAGRLRIWYAGNHIADISGTDTTYNVTVDSLGIHVIPNFWGIGTSEYTFPGPTSVNMLQADKQMSIYPNPASSHIQINSFTNYSGKDYYIKNIQGQTVESNILKNNNIDISGYAPGIYFLIIGNETYKLVKQ